MARSPRRSRLAAGALCALALAAPAVPSPSPAAAAYRVVTEWGREGFGPGQFGTGREAVGGDRQYNSPGGIAVDARGDVYVADTSNNRIQRFSATGRFEAAFGRFQFDPGAIRVGATRGFILPQGIAIRGASLFVADNRNDRVVRWSTSGRFQARLGRRGSLPGQMVSPWGIAVDGATVYVVDQGNAKIQRWSASGRSLGSFARFGDRAADLRAPYGIAVRAGQVFVSDTKHDAIKVYTTSGRFVRQFGGPGDGPGLFDQPAGLAFDRAGRLLVADCANQRIQVLTPAGRFVESFGEGVLRDPTFLAVGPDGQVYVSDDRKVVRFDRVARGDGRGEADEPPARAACSSQAEPAA